MQQIADAELVKDWMLQVRTSYLPNEILWGYRFEHSCVSYDKQEAKYAVSITNLNKISADNTPRYIRRKHNDKNIFLK